jgi:hypothetical protein
MSTGIPVAFERPRCLRMTTTRSPASTYSSTAYIVGYLKVSDAARYLGMSPRSVDVREWAGMDSNHRPTDYEHPSRLGDVGWSGKHRKLASDRDPA